MRQIRFRAWDPKENKMWNTNHIVVGKDTFLYGGHNTKTLVHSYVLRNDLIPMQFTGLLDSKGVGIYEGDIIEHRLGATWKVYWAEGGAQFMIEAIGASEFQEMEEGMNVEVIGNIYQNPDLL